MYRRFIVNSITLKIEKQCNIISFIYVGTSASNDSGSGSSVPIIAGATGGAVSFIIILLVVAFLYWKWRLQKKKTYSIPTTYWNADTTSEFSQGL